MIGGALPLRMRSAVLAATVGAVGLGLVALTLPVAARAALRPCSSYPTPGSPAAAGSAVAPHVLARYAVLRTPQTAADRLPREIDGSLGASGVVHSGIRLVGRAAFGGRIYLVPAEHLLPSALSPPRCLPAAQRSQQRQLLPKLRQDYRHPAVCVVVVTGGAANPTCVSADNATPDALLYANGTSGYGLVADGVSDVTVTYQTAAARTVPVHRNFFSIITPSVGAQPCGVLWLDRSGTVTKIPAGCSYMQAEVGALQDYIRDVGEQLAALQPQLAALASAVSTGSLAQAQAAWLTAHLTWLDLGQDDGAYGCFGALGGEIDGLAAGDPLGTADPHFTGFHRIEYDLWTTHDLAAAATDTAELQKLLNQLVASPLSSYLPADAAGVAGWILRPHEIIEDALRDSLTASDDYGSGTDLASVSADESAVRELLGLVAPILEPLAPKLVQDATKELDGLSTALSASQVNGGWVSIEDLPTQQRQQIDADLGAAAETLAPVPDLLTSTGRSTGPAPPVGDD